MLALQVYAIDISNMIKGHPLFLRLVRVKSTWCNSMYSPNAPFTPRGGLVF